MTAEIYKKYVWNNKEYCNLRYGDGSCITLSAAIGTYTDQEWIDLAISLYDAQPEDPDPMLQIVMSCPDQMLIDEVIRRHLVIVVEG